MNIYSRLLRLYRRNMVKTLLEDFCTEILAGILSGSSETGDAFVNEVLKIEGSGFVFETQKSFCSPDTDHPDCRVDLVISAEGMVCFVENKVESREGYMQLERYSSVLENQYPQLQTYLRYCTKYYDTKDIDLHDFRQFRWADVFKFLRPWESSVMVGQFLDFLNEHDMSDNMEFTLHDLTALQEISPVLKKMDRYLEKIKVIFSRCFDSSLMRESKNLQQIKMHSRYIFHLAYVFGDVNYSELGVGFDFADGTVPQLKVWIWTNDKNSKAPAFKTAIQHTSFLNNGENWLGTTKPLTDFLSAPDMEKDIENWFADAFASLHEFAKNHPELDWHILKKEKPEDGAMAVSADQISR